MMQISYKNLRKLYLPLLMAGTLAGASFAQADRVKVDFSDIVASGHGVELYNIGTEKQLSYFMTFHKGAGSEWKTYHLPRVTVNGSVRESCAIEGMPLRQADGTIYLACAGGILNKLTPLDSNTYRHEFWALDGSADIGKPIAATQNSANASLMVTGDTVVFHPQVVYDFPSSGQRSTSFFGFFEHKVTYSTLFNNGLINEEDLKTGKAEQKQREGYGVTYHETLDLLQKGQCNPGQDSFKIKGSKYGGKEVEFCDAALMKDGPFKELAKAYWNRHGFIEAPELARSMADKLMPGLGAQWTDDILLRKGKAKIKPEKIPFYKTRVAAVSGDESRMFVTVTNTVYQLNHSTGDLVRVGDFDTGLDTKADTTGLVALDENTILVSSMGEGEDNNKAPTLQFVKVKTGDSYEATVDKGLGEQFASSMADLWGDSMTPRVKSIASYTGTSSKSICGAGNTALYIRTKHASNDNVEACIDYSSGSLSVKSTRALDLSSHYNQQYVAAVANGLVRSPELEDIARDEPLWIHGSLHRYAKDYVSIYPLRKTQSEEPKKIQELPEIPGFIRFGGYGLNGIHVR